MKNITWFFTFFFKITLVRINEDDQITQSCFYRNKNLWWTNITQNQTVYANQISSTVDRSGEKQNKMWGPNTHQNKATLSAPGTSTLLLPVALHILTHVPAPVEPSGSQSLSRVNRRCRWLCSCLKSCNSPSTRQTWGGFCYWTNRKWS